MRYIRINDSAFQHTIYHGRVGFVVKPTLLSTGVVATLGNNIIFLRNGEYDIISREEYDMHKVLERLG